MGKFGSFIKSAFSYPRQLLKTHPVTATGITATSVLFAIHSFIDAVTGYEPQRSIELPLEILLHISIAMLFFSIFALCIESIRAGWRPAVKYAFFAFFALLSLFMSFIWSALTDNSHRSFWMRLRGIRNSLGPVTVMMYTVALLVIAILIAVYFSYSHGIRQPFNDHVMNAYSNLFFTSIIYGVIQVGVLLLTVIVTILLYNDAFEYLGPVLILINGLFFTPAVVCALIKENEKANIFIQILIRYVTLIIVMLAYVIIYIYMLKLVITASVPSNSVYAILTALFVISMFTAYLCTTFENKGFLQKFAYNAPLVFAPFILMQCYTIIVRIGQYGLTPKRYFGVAFIIFEIIYIVYYTYSYRKNHEIAGRNLLLIVCAIIVVTVFIPGINARSLSIASARRTLSTYLDKYRNAAQIPDSEYLHASAAYDLLQDSDFGEGKLAKYFATMDEEEVDALRESAKNAKMALKDKDLSDDDDYIYSYPRSAYYSAELMEVAGSDQIDISSYNMIRNVKIVPSEKTEYDDDTTPVDTSRLKVCAYHGETEVTSYEDALMTIDLKDYCKKVVSLSTQSDNDIISYQEYQDQCARTGIVDINENARLYITNADISRDKNDTIVNVSIIGYLLTK